MTLYLAWQDDTKKPTAQKITEGAARYQERFGHAPKVVCVSLDTTVEGCGLRVQAVREVEKNVFWFGMEER